MSNIWITGDHHFCHANAIKYDKRPFSSAEEMNDIMIERHNKFVKKNDIVYSVGDFCFSNNPNNFEDIKSRLNGKWHLVIGNHDHQPKPFLRKHFETIHEIKKIQFNKQKIILSHYPMYVWDCSHYGSYHCHGHEHGNLKDTYDQTGKILDVGVMTNNYFPYNIDTILARMKGKPDNWNEMDNRRRKT